MNEQFKFNVNLVDWNIIEMDWISLNKEYGLDPEVDGAIDAFTKFGEKTVLLREDLDGVEIIKNIFHELTHVYIGSYWTSDYNKTYTEEDIATFVQNFGIPIVFNTMDYIFYRDNEEDYNSVKRMILKYSQSKEYKEDVKRIANNYI